MTLKKYIDKIFPQIRDLRREFHKHPEQGWLEIGTSAILKKELEKLGYKPIYGNKFSDKNKKMGLPDLSDFDIAYKRALESGLSEEEISIFKNGNTGMYCDIGRGENIIAFRFDIDALPIKETDSIEHYPNKMGFNSIYSDSMHACGHDVHAATGIGLALLIKKMGLDDNLKIRLIFQPAEEGVRGALSIAETSVFDNVKYLIGHHILSGYNKNEIMCGMGGYLSTTKFDVQIIGTPSHAGSSPQNGNNAMLAACNAVINMNSIPRTSDGASRINIGKLVSGTGRNIIPDHAFMCIETRGDCDSVNKYMFEKCKNILEHSCGMYNCDYNLKICGKAHTAYSDPFLINIIETIVNKNKDLIKISSDRAMGSEDFTIMMKKVQENGGKAVNIGIGAGINEKFKAHTHNYDIDENCMKDTLYIFYKTIEHIQQEIKKAEK